MSRYVYYTLADDGADFRCSQCQERSPASEMVILYDTERQYGQVCHNNGWCADISALTLAGNTQDYERMLKALWSQNETKA